MSDKMLILEGLLEANEIRRSDDGRLRFMGLALRDNTLSANNWFYGESMIDESIRRTQEWQEAGNVTTIYSTHGQALGSFLSMPIHSPIGKIPKLYRERGEMRYEAQISPTEEGKDMMTLIEDKVVVHTSIRSSIFEAEPVTMSVDGEEREVMEVKWAIITGIDFCDQPGVAGAGIVKVMESAPTITHVEDTMELKDVTLEMLREERPDLLNSLVVEHLSLLQAQIEQKTGEVASLTAELEAVKESAVGAEVLAEAERKATEAEAALTEATGKVALWEEVSIPLVKEMYRLRAEHADWPLEDVRAAAIQTVHAETDGNPAAGGETDEDDNDSLEESNEINESMAQLLGATLALSKK